MIPAASAAAVSPSAPTAAALGFNVFTRGNTTLTSNESEGPVAIGGNLTIGGNYQVGGATAGTFTVAGDARPSALVIGGAVNFAGSAPAVVQVQSQGYAKVGDLSNADVRDTDDNHASVNTRIVADGASYDSQPRVQLNVQQPVASVGPATPIDFATAFQDFRSSATDLATCDNTVTLTDAQGVPLPANLPPGTNAFITLAPNVTNVLNISAANLANIATLTYQNQPTATSPLLINVNTGGVGNVFNWTVPTQAGVSGGNAPFILWNFPTVTTLTLAQNGATLEGTLYAPNAGLTDLSSSNIEGQVIVDTLVHGTAANNGGEMHHFPFTATLSCAGVPTPDLTTSASSNVTLGGQVSDTATLAGGEDPTGMIMFNLYGPDDATCAGPAVFTSSVTVDGDGVYPSDDFTPTATGVYRWIASYSGDANNAGVSTLCNDANESVVVGPAVVTPALTTDASDGVTLGGQVSDTATLTGGQNPTGTITFSLYGPDSAACLGTPVFSSAAPVSGNGNYASQQFTPTQTGTYRWVASYSGDAGNAPVTTACLDPNESVAVAAVAPTLTTDASDNITLGGQVNDVATLAGGSAPTGSITFNLYGPDNATCTGTPVFTSTVPVSGNGSYPSAQFTPTQAGTYRWTAGYSGDANNAAATTSCNDPNESVVVSQGQVTPTLSTDASDDVTLGGQVSDTATLAGGNAPTGSITFNLYGPNDATCSNDPVFTATVPVTGNAAYPSGPFTPTQTGTYRWIASYSGDAGNAAVTMECNDANESVVVNPAVVTPTLSTDASGNVPLGGQVNDVATLAGGQNPTGTITFSLYGPENATCAGLPVFTSTVPVSGNGDYPSEQFTPPLLGTYRWIASYSGDAGNAAVAGACNDDNESVTVLRGSITPTLTTDASDDVTLGGQVSDTATLAGGNAPTGTITFNLYGPNDATCSNDPVFTASVPVNGNAAYPSGPFTPTQAGTYRWIASYSGDGNNGAVAMECNDPGESVVVNPAVVTPTLSTDASDDVTLGGQVSDTATLAGGNAPTGSITFNLYGPNDATCSNDPVFTATVPVTGNAAYPSGPFTPTQTGTYRWIASYTGDGNNNAVAMECNDANESVVVNPAVVTPTLSTDASDDITLGGQINDVATLRGGQSPTGSITFNLYGPNDATCGDDPVFTSTVPVTGNGVYPSQQFTPTLAGTYRWVASYSGDANNAAVGDECNAPGESVVVTAGQGTPTLTTRASRDTYVGKEIYDTATLAGGNAPTGTITFRLYGPGDATCSRRPVFTTTVDVSGNGDYRSDAFRAKKPGTYQWVASYSGDDANQAVQTSCGDPAEQVVVKKKGPYGGKPRP
ncbi:choice-of-anchor A family protein [Catellatospora methionotrophica]|uniref:choice-of-anchor A family protein n=1 Tax=Catellatospora methionotrophica TaxID=121620 RepID=UPI00140A5642|nr:choice-of-anchor A family protein [Catellatospora methionotrophica]